MKNPRINATTPPKSDTFNPFKPYVIVFKMIAVKTPAMIILFGILNCLESKYAAVSRKMHNTKSQIIN